jgi:hypothetical protein
MGSFFRNLPTLLILTAGCSSKVKDKDRSFSLELGIFPYPETNRSIAVDECEGVNLGLVDSGGGHHFTDEDIKIALVTDGPDDDKPAALYRDKDCGSKTTSYTIKAGSNASEGDLFIKSSAPGKITLKATSSEATKNASIKITAK